MAASGGSVALVWVGAVSGEVAAEGYEGVEEFGELFPGDAVGVHGDLDEERSAIGLDCFHGWRRYLQSGPRPNQS